MVADGVPGISGNALSLFQVFPALWRSDQASTLLAFLPHLRVPLLPTFVRISFLAKRKEQNAVNNHVAFRSMEFD